MSITDLRHGLGRQVRLHAYQAICAQYMSMGPAAAVSSEKDADQHIIQTAVHCDSACCRSMGADDGPCSLFLLSHRYRLRRRLEAGSDEAGALAGAGLLRCGRLRPGVRSAAGGAAGPTQCSRAFLPDADDFGSMTGLWCGARASSDLVLSDSHDDRVPASAAGPMLCLGLPRPRHHCARVRRKIGWSPCPVLVM